ncbi:MAG: glycosyltransferase family 39 protein, partial [Candidatus Acidiferrales bacterium]
MTKRSSPASEKLALCGLWVLIGYTLVQDLFAAAATPFSGDELLTLIVARQSSPSMIRSALARGADGQPPPFYLVERAAVALGPKMEIALRLPSILAFACVLLFVFVFVKRRSGPVYALVCAALLLDTVLYYPFAINARPYELLVACIALALVCYQRAPETRWVILMGLSLLAAEAMHYYAIFAFAPFGIAEIAQSLKTHRLRLGVWLALACGILPLAIFWPLLRLLKQMYGAHLWDEPILSRAATSYAWFLRMP